MDKNENRFKYANFDISLTIIIAVIIVKKTKIIQYKTFINILFEVYKR